LTSSDAMDLSSSVIPLQEAKPAAKQESIFSLKAPPAATAAVERRREQRMRRRAKEVLRTHHFHAHHHLHNTRPGGGSSARCHSASGHSQACCCRVSGIACSADSSCRCAARKRASSSSPHLTCFA
jgi:hypothetical protein